MKVPIHIEQAFQGGLPNRFSLALAEIERVMQENHDIARIASNVYTITVVTKDDAKLTWTLDLRSAPGRIVEGVVDGLEPACGLQIREANFVDIMFARQSAITAFYEGQLTISGKNPFPALKLETALRAGLAKYAKL